MVRLFHLTASLGLLQKKDSKSNLQEFLIADTRLSIGGYKFALFTRYFWGANENSSNELTFARL